MYCTKCGAQIPDGSTFCTSCGARVGGVEDQAEPVAFPVGDSTLVGDPAAPAPSSAPAGRQAEQGAPAHMAAQPQYEQPFAEPAEPFDMTPQPKKPKHRGRIVAAVIGGVAVVAIVAAIVIVPRIGASSEVTSGGKGYVVCACETKVLPKNSKGKKLKSYTVELAPVSGKGKSYTIKVDGEDGFAMEDFGELPDQKYQMTITSGKGKKKSTTTMKVDYTKESSDAPKNVELTQSKKEAKASAKAAVKTANELFTDKILEYQKKYGEGEAVEIDDSQSTYGAQGVAYAKLVDFDGDGQDELLIEYSDEPVDRVDNAAAAHLEVWAYKNGEIEKVYTPEVNVSHQEACVSVWLDEYEGKIGFSQWYDHGTAIKQSDLSGESGPSAHEYQVKFIGYDGKSFKAMTDLVAPNEVGSASLGGFGFLYADESSVNSTIGTVATTLEQLKSKDAGDDAQVSYEAVSATQDVSFTAPVGEGAPDPDVTCQISATWTYPQVKGQGVGVAKFNKDMIQLVADALDASKQATPYDEDNRVTTMYYAEIVSIDGDIACVRTYTDSYQPPYRSEQVTRSAYYSLKTGEQVSLEDSLAQHGLSFDTLKSEAKQAIKAAKTNMYSSYANSYEDDDNFTEDHFYYDGKGYVVVLDTGVFDCDAWGTHDLVAHAFDSSYSGGQDVTPEYPRYTYTLNE